MNVDRLPELFEHVTDLPAGERMQFVMGLRGEDAAFTEDLIALIAADEDAGHNAFWDRSALHNEVLADSGSATAVGEIVGNYRLLELLGKGGMGAVYRAERMDAQFDKCVAVKLIDAVFYSPNDIAQFRSERQILANLDHPNIARLLDGGARADGMPYLVMEYVEGVPPRDFCRAHNLSIDQRLQLFRQICSAVHSAHQNMVIHRDLKPANILVTEDGTPKLLDFGIAKVLTPVAAPAGEALTQPGMLKLTARYASPEQVRGELVTTASDVYSLGVILYELLTEHSPYGDADRPAHMIMHAVCEEAPTRPSVWVAGLKGDIDNIVLRALAKAPADRYASADQFSEDILRYLDGRPVLAHGEAPLYVAAKFVRRNRVPVAAAVLVLCSLVVGLVEVTLARARAERRFNEVRQLAHSVMFDYADAIDRLPGSTPVRARMVKDALIYLDSLSKEAETPQLQKEIVDAYVRVSNVQGNEYENNLGDTEGGMSTARKAEQAAEKLLREDQSPAAESSAAGAFSTYGSLLYSSGDLKTADDAYRHALDVYRKIAAAAPADLDNQVELITCLRHLGDLYGGFGFKTLGRNAEGLAYYEQGKALALSLMAKFPANVDLIKASYKVLLSLAPAENAMGRQAQAAKDVELALAQIQRASVAEPANTNVTVELAIGEARLGQLLVDDRRFPEAVAHTARASELLEKLLDADPTNAVYRRLQSIVEAQWGAALRGTGEDRAAVAHNQRGFELIQALNKDAPGSTQYRSDLGGNERKLSEALLAVSDAKAALRYAQEAEQILCQNDAGDATGLAACGRALVAVGNAYQALHDAKASVPVLQTAVEIATARSAADPLSTMYRSDSARAQAALATGLAETGDDQGARANFDGALRTWAGLREAKAISAEDAYRADVALLAMANLKGPR